MATRPLSRRFLPTLAAVLLASPVQAQFWNPYAITPAQYYFNLQAAAARAYNPWYGGYGYAFNLARTAPLAVPPSWPNPAGLTPYAGVNPYAPITGAGIYSNPYTTGGGNLSNPYSTDPYSPFNPYNPYQTTTPLHGAAEIMRAYGTAINDLEKARILREYAQQAKLETQKKKFDLNKYIRDNTPSYTEEQAKILKNTLKRIQTNSSPTEILSGKALNLLLDDIRQHPYKKSAIEAIPVSENILRQINVISKSAGSLGAIRNEGRFSWPAGLQDILPADKRRTIETQTQNLYRGALYGKIDQNVLRDLNAEMERVREKLIEHFNDLPQNHYYEARQFLNDFDQARIALAAGEVPVQAAFERFVIGGKPIQEVADYLISKGLRFAPAAVDDEAAYRALYSAMAAFDVALNSETATASNVSPANDENKK